jgi:oligoendopeptidase F
MSELSTPFTLHSFLPKNFTYSTWDELLPYFNVLKDSEISSLSSLESWLVNKSELEAFLQEDLGWRYIKQTCDTNNEEKRNSLHFFIQEIEPHIANFFNLFNKKLLSSPFLNELSQEKYGVYLRGIKKEVQLFREENIPLLTEIQTLANEYGQIMGGLSVEVDGKVLTFQQASNYLKLPDRDKRKEVYLKINNSRIAEKDKLEGLFDKLIQLRHQVAVNAGYANYRDYMFDALGRFDYTSQQCLDFHHSVENLIVPIVENYELTRKEKLGYDNLYPWDMDVDADNLPALKPYETGEDLIKKTIDCFNNVDPSFGKVIEIMAEKGHLDLDSRLGKAPGGYNYPLYLSGLPFIFMNSAGNIRDMVTMMHEGGHAIHSWLSKDLELTGFKNTPSEIAEVASMAMELISMEHWEVFFENSEDLKRAKKYQLEKILSILPWIATIDAFQHWLYENPNHSREERLNQWLLTYRRFSGNIIDRSEYQEFEAYSWHRQLHLFEVPFYYIEYGIAQLGAIGVWRNYKLNPDKALNQYKDSLSEGYLKTLPELYSIAGVKFDFSSENVSELVKFVSEEQSKFD